MSQNHLIFGAGPLAQAVMRALLKRGNIVKMVNRSGKRPADVPAQVELLAGDAYNPEFARQAAQGMDVIYQCAQPAYHHWVQDFPALRPPFSKAPPRRKRN